MKVGHTHFYTVLYLFLQVGTNGIISFGAPWRFFDPMPFPTNSLSTRDTYVVALFWNDHDMRLEGDIFYETHSALSGNPTSSNLLDYVSAFIRNRTQSARDFSGQWMLVAQWDEVHPYPHGRFSDLSLFTEEYRNFVQRVSTVTLLTPYTITNILGTHKMFNNYVIMTCFGMWLWQIPRRVLALILKLS